jgi:hypothetical protein
VREKVSGEGGRLGRERTGSAGWWRGIAHALDRLLPFPTQSKRDEELEKGEKEEEEREGRLVDLLRFTLAHWTCRERVERLSRGHGTV